MGIFEECAEPPRTKNYRGAKLDSILQSMDKKDRESLIAALMEESIPAERISNVLSKRGISVGRQAINFWRMANVKKES